MYRANKLFLLFLLSGAMFFSCDSNSYKTTESGLKYKFIEEGEGEVPAPGEVMIVNIAYKDGKDSVLFSSIEQGEPMPMPVDSTWKNDGSIFEIFKMVKKGDSIEVQTTFQKFFEKTVKQPMPDTVEAEGLITFNIGVADVMTMEDYRAHQMKQFEKQQQEAASRAVEQLKKDEVSIDEYLKENNISAQKSESGLRYVILEEGKGPEAEVG